MTSDDNPEANTSALSRHLSDMPTDVSLIMDEKPLSETASSHREDYNDSQDCAISIGKTAI